MHKWNIIFQNHFAGKYLVITLTRKVDAFNKLILLFSSSSSHSFKVYKSISPEVVTSCN
jgi:hypothetical protein